MPSQPSSLFRLADVNTTDQLARALGVPLQIFHDVIACENPHTIYYMHRIPKRNPRNAGDDRIAWESRQEPLARSHKAVARRLDDFARHREIGYPNAAVHGYVRGGSTRSNAQPHCGARVVVRADIEDFFPTITAERIQQMLCALGMKNEPARALTRFATIDGLLPLGFPESPVISNLTCLGLDRDLQALADGLKVTYTRYADDITFSGGHNLPSKEEIRAILRKHEFRLSERKFKKSKRGQGHFVTGLSVSERDYPHVPRKMKRRLRLELHFCEKFGLESHAARLHDGIAKTFLRLEGMAQYVAFIERRQSEAIKEQWDRVLREYHGPTSYAKIKDKDPRDRFVIGDETEFNVGTSRYLAICLVRITNLENVERAIEVLSGDYSTKPGAKGKLHLLDKVGIHYTDAHPDLRTITLDLMTDFLPWSGSIYFAQLNTPEDYADTYLKLFNESIKQEFITSDEWNMEILIEQNSKVKTPRLEQIVRQEYEQAKADDGRRPKSLPTIRTVTKGDTRAITLPDFVLAAFRAYILHETDDSVLDFERIRDRVRYVHDMDNGNYYTRKRPFVNIGSA